MHLSIGSTGNIYFNYVDLPTLNISTSHHAHHIGLSDAYLSEHQFNDHLVKTVTLYDKINLARDNLRNGVSVRFQMDQSNPNGQSASHIVDHRRLSISL